MESYTTSGGSIRGWKRLARERDVVVQASIPSFRERSVDECLEGVEDLVPIKR